MKGAPTVAAVTPWRAGLALLVVVRLALPLAVLAASPGRVPGMAAYEYDPLAGDAYAYYFALREIHASLRVGLIGLAALVVIAVAAVVVWRWWRRGALAGSWAFAAAALLVFCALAVPVAGSDPSGAGAVGWPLLWSLPLLPYRALGLPLDPDVAFGFAVALSVVANAATVIAVAWAGREVSGRAHVGLGAGALVTLWPFVAATLAGSSAWDNGNWLNDIGLSATTEPLSTALVAVSLALMVDRRPSTRRLAIAGLCLGFAVAVRPTNLLFVAVAAAWLAWTRRRELWQFAVCAATPLPIVIAFAGKGYGKTGGNDPSPPPDWHNDDVTFAFSYAPDAFADSLVFGPSTLAVLLPLAVVGLVSLPRRRDAALLTAFVLSTPALYAWFWATPQHPRYFYASLPALLILCSAGVSAVTRRVARL
jgi:hypothetical protein